MMLRSVMFSLLIASAIADDSVGVVQTKIAPETTKELVEEVVDAAVEKIREGADPIQTARKAARVAADAVKQLGIIDNEPQTVVANEELSTGKEVISLLMRTNAMQAAITEPQYKVLGFGASDGDAADCTGAYGTIKTEAECKQYAVDRWGDYENGHWYNHEGSAHPTGCWLHSGENKVYWKSGKSNPGASSGESAVICKLSCYPGCSACDGSGQLDCSACTDGSAINDDDGDAHGSCLATPAYDRVGTGLCSDPYGIRTYEGNGDNEGTTDQRLDRCAMACKTQIDPLAYGPWGARGEALGFGMTTTNGRCYCNHVPHSACAKKAHVYQAYEYKAPTTSTRRRCKGQRYCGPGNGDPCCARR